MLLFLYHLGTATLYATELIEPASPEIPPHPLLAIATTLLHDLIIDQTITTVYSHENRCNDREMRFNCYGLIAHLLNLCHTSAFEDLLTHMENLHLRGFRPSLDPGVPSPENFFHIFKNIHAGNLTSIYWQGVEDIATMVSGDLVAYLPQHYQSPTTFDKDTHQQTGTHIMIISSVLNRTSQSIKIRIIDSSHQPHHCDDEDTRHQLKIKGGIGECTLHIKKTDVPGIYWLIWGTQNKAYMKKELFAGRLLS